MRLTESTLVVYVLPLTIRCLLWCSGTVTVNKYEHGQSHRGQSGEKLEDRRRVQGRSQIQSKGGANPCLVMLVT
jgi:hypothetical protein